MKFPKFLVAFLCGVSIATLEARVVNRDRRSFFDAPKIPKFPSVVLVGLVDQPVPTVVGIPQQTPYSPPSYGSQPLPHSYPSPSYSPPSYPPPTLYSPPSYPPPSYQPAPSYSPSSYASPSSSYAPKPPSYMPPPMPYQPPQYTPMYAQAQIPMHNSPPAQQPFASEQHEQSVPVPKEEDLPSNVDPTAATNFQTESSDSMSANLTNDSKSDDESNWETSTSSVL